MINKLVNWWRSYQFRSALKQGKIIKAKRLLTEIESSGVRLSWLEKLYKKLIVSENNISQYKQKILSLQDQLTGLLQSQEKLEVDFNFIKYVRSCFKFIEYDEGKCQVTGIDEMSFDSLEIALVDLLENKLEQIPTKRLQHQLTEAIEDLEKLKNGIDPNYSYGLSSDVYLMKYFLQNIYSNYLAWFLIYEAGLLSKTIKILDVAAGPGTVAYGLALLLQNSQGFLPIPQMHISYYSLEQQETLQLRGLQFWRQYLEKQNNAPNFYFRFDTADIFDYPSYSQKLPKFFFDFIVISHCFFHNSYQRQSSHKIYREIFRNHLAIDGYILLIVQGQKLVNTYQIYPGESIEKEQKLIKIFLKELDLKLEWYQYLTSTGRRTKTDNFYQFAKETLPKQKYMATLHNKYFHQGFVTNYAIDDYIILAKN
jgi:SAM-dependent methyltransferase